MQKFTLVKAPGGGGLGDRLRAVLAGALYSSLTERILVVDWADGVYAKLGTNAFPLLFELCDVRNQTGLPVSESVDPPAWRARLEKPMAQIWREDGDPPWDRSFAIDRYSGELTLANPAEVVVLWEFDRLDLLLEMANSPPGRQLLPGGEARLSELFHRYLAVRPELRSEAETFSGSQLQGPTVGVHVRMTKEAEKSRGNVSLDEYFRILDRVIETADIRSIFLATDNEEVLHQFRARYASVVVRPKWFAEPGEPLHLNQQCPDLLRSARDAVTELCVLASCDHLISAGNSSFSLVARMMSRSRSIITLPLPTRWARLKRNLRRLMPQSQAATD